MQWVLEYGAAAASQENAGGAWSLPADAADPDQEPAPYERGPV